MSIANDTCSLLDNPLISLEDRLEIAKGAIAFRNEIIKKRDDRIEELTKSHSVNSEWPHSALLEKHGWEIECESPIEIRHIDSSFATGGAALLIIENLLQQQEEDNIDKWARLLANDIAKGND